jgi:acyl carrier protein
MTAGEGLEALGRLLRQGSTQAAILRVAWPTYCETFRTRGVPPFFAELDRYKAEAGETGGSESKPKRSLSFLDCLAQIRSAERWDFLLDHLRSQLRETLGLERAETLDPERGFFDIGMDSLTAVELRTRLQASLGRALPTTVVFDHPSLRALADYVGRTVLDLEHPQKPETELRDGEEGDGRSALADRRDLSEDEMAALLAAKLKQLR